MTVKTWNNTIATQRKGGIGTKRTILNSLAKHKVKDDMGELIYWTGLSITELEKFREGKP